MISTLYKPFKSSLLATALLKDLGFCFSLPKLYLKFTLLELCQQFSRLSFTDSCNSLRKSTQFSVSKASLADTLTQYSAGCLNNGEKKSALFRKLAISKESTILI